jgi:MFS family permease
MPTEGIIAKVGQETATSLANRTYIGLLVAQFLAAFNDQAIHASAMFFAINTQTLTEASAISLMPILFYAPWAIFCTLAGYLADRYSKRATLVFWKFAEIAITAVAFLGFWLGTHGHPQFGTWIVLSTVFLMGMHSAFFVPAKYGIMPEILRSHLLSKGNGLLESLSFLAVILGTVSGGVLSFLFVRQEYVIGVILLVLAMIGAAASLLMDRVPAANPGLKFPPYLYKPLFHSLRVLFSAKAIVFAVIGIAFFTFVVAFMRATVYMLGESQNPRWDELRTSVIVGTVALGIGLGSPLAGWLSGRKVELGLIPIGALGMVVGCMLAACTLDVIPALVGSIILIGFSTGFYLVPLFTLLQHRAPKTGKGDTVATSNLINVTGATVASALFFFLVFLAKKVDFIEKVPVEPNWARGRLTTLEMVRGRPKYFEVAQADGIFVGGNRPAPGSQPPTAMEQIFGRSRPRTKAPIIIHVDRDVELGSAVIVSRYELRGVEHLEVRGENDPLTVEYDAQHLPRFLFIGAGLMTLGTLLVLWRRLPDLPHRSVWVVRNLFGPRVALSGIYNLPSEGPTVLAIANPDPALHGAIRSATDRYTCIVNGNPNNLEIVASRLRKGGIVGVTLDNPKADELLRSLAALLPIKVVPVFAQKENSAYVVGFGAKLEAYASMPELEAKIAEARFAEDQ